MPLNRVGYEAVDAGISLIAAVIVPADDLALVIDAIDNGGFKALPQRIGDCGEAAVS